MWFISNYRILLRLITYLLVFFKSSFQTCFTSACKYVNKRWFIRPKFLFFSSLLSARKKWKTVPFSTERLSFIRMWKSPEKSWWKMQKNNKLNQVKARLLTLWSSLASCCAVFWSNVSFSSRLPYNNTKHMSIWNDQFHSTRPHHQIQ